MITKRGFSLVELLIVVAIIGILTAIVIPSTSTARARARDNRRITDMKEIQLGLALYYDVNRAYPDGTTISVLSVLTAEKYLPSIPSDPTGGAYEYVTSNGARTYCLGVKLEGAVPNDSSSCALGAGTTANYKASR